MFFFLFILLILSLAEGGVENDLDYLRLLDDRLMYQIAYKSANELPENIVSSREKLIQITSPDQEQYQCLIPTVNTYSKKRIESYVGPSPAELLQPIYDEKICSYKFESYWNYELCHGQYILQYHEEKETKSRTDYYLGNFVSVSAVTEARNFDQLSPPTKKIGDEMRAYYPVTYIHGTNCDITGKPRQTAVLYVCDEDARQNIYSFTEISSCQYELIVLSSELCAHPAFQVIPHKEHEISCFPMDRLPGEDPKPKALLKVEEETENQFMQEYALFKDTSTAKTAQQIFSKLFQVEENVIEDGFNQLNAIIESFKKAAQENAAAGQSGQTSKPTSRFSLASKEQQQQMAKKASPPPQMSEMEKVVHGFWRGKVCLNGGTGWWKYEVCYGKTVTQFHHEMGKPRQNILLGVFDREVHKAWATEHPNKAVERNSEGTVLQVTNLYTRGEICEQTNAHRSCELRMRCRNDIAAQKVFIYMLEPATCQYFVVLESPLFCDALQKVDKFGLFPEGALVENSMAPEQREEEGQSAKEEEKPKISHLIFEERKIAEEGEEGEVEGNNDKNVVKRKTKVEIGLINQEEIMRIVQNLVQGMNDGQVTVDMTKIKIPLSGADDSEEEAEKEAAAAGGGNEPKKEEKNAGQIGAVQNAEESTENNSADERKSTQKRKLGNDGGEL